MYLGRGQKIGNYLSATQKYIFVSNGAKNRFGKAFAFEIDVVVLGCMLGWI
jgi:hypothetical protein